jgi:hypothetical protein
MNGSQVHWKGLFTNKKQDAVHAASSARKITAENLTGRQADIAGERNAIKFCFKNGCLDIDARCDYLALTACNSQ